MTDIHIAILLVVGIGLTSELSGKLRTRAAETSRYATSDETGLAARRWPWLRSRRRALQVQQLQAIWVQADAALKLLRELDPLLPDPLGLERAAADQTSPRGRQAAASAAYAARHPPANDNQAPEPAVDAASGSAA